jgi:hypothetical protein
MSTDISSGRKQAGKRQGRTVAAVASSCVGRSTMHKSRKAAMLVAEVESKKEDNICMK